MREVFKLNVTQFWCIHSRRHYVELQQTIFGQFENVSGKVGERFLVHFLLAACQKLEGL
jgi:hypothetical protein